MPKVPEKCSRCGAPISWEEGASIVKCDFCGYKNNLKNDFLNFKLNKKIKEKINKIYFPAKKALKNKYAKVILLSSLVSIAGFFINKTINDPTRPYKVKIDTACKNISSNHPIAILNSGKQNSIRYTGDNAKKSTSTITGTTADGTYDFYYGDVTVTVTDNFDKVSIYCRIHGYMGGENLIVYAQPKKINKMLTAGDQIARVKARRVCKCTDYDMETSGNTACSGT